MTPSDCYNLFGLNQPLFHLINDIKSPALDPVMLAATFVSDYRRIVFYGPLLVLIAALAVWRQSSQNRMSEASLWLVSVATFFGAVVADGAFLSVMKPLLDMPRPVLALGASAVKVLGPVELHHSFPSGHTSFATLLVVSLWLVLPKLGRLIAVLFLVTTAVSRVYVGAHFPVDVLGGFVTCFIVTMIMRSIALLVVPVIMRRMGSWRVRSTRVA